MLFRTDYAITKQDLEISERLHLSSIEKRCLVRFALDMSNRPDFYNHLKEKMVIEKNEEREVCSLEVSFLSRDETVRLIKLLKYFRSKLRTDDEHFAHLSNELYDLQQTLEK